MGIAFPNASRSYDATRDCVRFWGYDDALEVSFFLERAALERLGAGSSEGEPELLAAFDANLQRVQKRAARIYSRHSKSSYTLKAADF